MKNQERNARRKKNFKFGKINNIKRKNLETEYYVKMQELFLVENMNDGWKSGFAYGVYDKLVDDFNNEEWYWLCGFYLTQAIMRMYGNEK